jgi:MerR family transcriptional regulator, light-induced transcriptional regulator
MNADTRLRIGELSRRAGVSPELLRAWERRYDVLRPTRSPGGLRLYSLEDLERVRLMSRHIAEGLAAREAAALAARATIRRAAGAPTGDSRAASAFDPIAARADLGRAMEAFDEAAAQAVVDELLAAATVDALLTDVLLPYLHDLGERWERGDVSVAQEHFASNLLRGRLLGLARGWGRGGGRRALLACPAGELHDLGLIAFGLALRARAWRVDFLGADTPTESIVETAATTEPELLVVSATTPERLRPVLAELALLAQRHRVAVAGAGATGLDGDPEGLLRLTADPVAEAERLSGLVSG